MLFENALIFHPCKYPCGQWAHGPEMEDCRLTATDDTALCAWLVHPAAPARSAVLHLQGNGGNMSWRRPLLHELSQAPTTVLALDYRGYGRSEGSPTEHGVYQDADAAWDYLTSTLHFPPSQIVIFGDSLGGAVAIELARRVHPAGLIVQSSFTSMPDMARFIVPFTPRSWMRSQFASIAKIGEIHCPKLFIHSRDDGTVPYWMGRRLYDAAPEPKQFYTIHDAAHNDTLKVGGPAYVSALRYFIAACIPPEEEP